MRYAFSIWFRYLRGSVGVLALTGIFLLVIGEVYLRLPGVTPVLLYEPDRELDGRLAPKQRGFGWLGGMSVRSAPASINADGHRGPDTDWSRPIVLTLAGSEGAGMGVEDDEVWTHHIEMGLRKEPELAAFEVVNAGHPGGGPYHQWIRMRRVMAEHSIRAVVVRVTLGAWSFLPVPEGERDARFEAARIRQKVRRYTRFLPFLYNKALSQVPRIESALIPTFLRSTPIIRRSDGRLGERMWQNHRRWWEEILDLAATEGVPVLFVIPDPIEDEGHRFLTTRLRELEAKYPDLGVLHLGAESFGLENYPEETRRREYDRQFTVHGDPHSNAPCHRIVGDAVVPHLIRILTTR